MLPNRPSGHLRGWNRACDHEQAHCRCKHSLGSHNLPVARILHRRPEAAEAGTNVTTVGSPRGGLLRWSVGDIPDCARLLQRADQLPGSTLRDTKLIAEGAGHQAAALLVVGLQPGAKMVVKRRRCFRETNRHSHHTPPCHIMSDALSP